MTDNPPLEPSSATLEDQLQAVQESLKECQDKYLRSLADSENTRKRMQKERQELMKLSAESILVEFLHPLDSFEKALKFAQNMSDEVKHWAIGFEMILNQFKHILSNHGIEAYRSEGEPFNPHLHEAIELVETSEHEPGIVIEECIRGYKIEERPIRVARVKVSKQPNKEGM